ncbi:MAG TPA: amidase [Xanthobacteraceae bacterium]|nr:amidase [Xanthobacteraceae bacterium]
MSADDLHYSGMLEVGKLVQSRKLSPVELTQAQLDRIGRLDGALKSFVHVMADTALEAARTAEKEIAAGNIKSPLHGVPVAVKDLCWTKDAPTAHGTTILRDHVPPVDGTVVTKLKDAGAIILGKLQQTEGAYADHHPKIDPPRNPWDEKLWPGVSSSGSGVATAAGLCYGSIGTDTGGSIRFPSGANSVTGLKPTWGRVSRYGNFELAATLDHIGPMTRSAIDCGAMLGVIAGEDPNDPTAVSLPVPDYLANLTDNMRGTVIGIDPKWSSLGVDADSQRALKDALKVAADLGAEIREVTFPDPEQIINDWFPLCAVQTATAHEAHYPARAAEYGPGLAGLIDLGRGLSGMDLHKIILRREEFKGRVRAMFKNIDLFAIPAFAVAAPTTAKMATFGEDAELISGMLRFTCPFDTTGSPSITLPGGFTASGGPIGFQFIGRDFEEARLVQAGVAFQSATDWHKKHPTL